MKLDEMEDNNFYGGVTFLGFFKKDIRYNYRLIWDHLLFKYG